MSHVVVEILDWTEESLAETLDYLRSRPDFDFKNLSLEDQEYQYRNGFGGSQLIGNIMDENRNKIGHGIVYLRPDGNGGDGQCLLLSDLYVDKSFRNLRTVTRLYENVRKVIEDRNVTQIYTVSNDVSTKINQRFLKITDYFTLRFGIGFSFGMVTSRSGEEITDAFLSGSLSEQLDPYFENNSLWDAQTLAQRLKNPFGKYKLHRFDDCLVVSQRTSKKGVPMAVVAAVFSKTERKPKLSRTMIRHVCACHKVLMYVGESRQLPLGLFGSWAFVKTLSVHTRDWPKDRVLNLIDLDLSLGSA